MTNAHSTSTQSDGSTICAIRMRRERDILRWLHSRGYPVPRVPEGMAATLDEGPTRSPSEVPPRLEMELINGASMAKHLSSHAANRTYVKQAAQTLVRLHRELHMITGAPVAWRYPTHQSEDMRKLDRGTWVMGVACRAWHRRPPCIRTSDQTSPSPTPSISSSPSPPPSPFPLPSRPRALSHPHTHPLITNRFFEMIGP